MAVPGHVVGGVDPHADTIHVAVLTAVGKPVADGEFRATADGYRGAVGFLLQAGIVDQVGVEGAACYGAGISRALTAAGLRVVEVDRPSRAERRRAGKSDRIDAQHAARAVLAERISPVKGAGIEGLRALHRARRSAVKAHTAALSQITSILVMAPEPVRAKYRDLGPDQLVAALARCRGFYADPTTAETLLALKSLAERCRFLDRQVAQLTAQIDPLVTAANPALRATLGVGPDTAAQLLITAGNNTDRLTSEASFAALCGVAPIPASSGKTRRHRLSRGGDRAANNALHRIALVRMSHHPTTRAYVARQRARGRRTPEIIQMLKRAIAREIYHTLTRPTPVPDITDLRPAREARLLTLAVVADHFDVWPATISRLERGMLRNDTLADQYRAWLAA